MEVSWWTPHARSGFAQYKLLRVQSALDDIDKPRLFRLAALSVLIVDETAGLYSTFQERVFGILHVVRLGVPHSSSKSFSVVFALSTFNVHSGSGANGKLLIEDVVEVPDSD